MIKNIFSLSPLNFTFFLPTILTCLFCTTSYNALANNIAVNHSQLEHYIALPNEEVLLTPAGEGIFLSLDLNKDWTIKFDYQHWQANQQAISPVSLDLALTSFGSNISYAKNNWYISTSIGLSEDDVSYRENQRRTDFRQEDTQVTSFSTMLGYNWLQGDWMFDASIGAQYADWSIKNKKFNGERAQQNGKPSEEATITKDNTSTINIGISAARYWELTEQQGILAGVMLSWSYQFLGDEKLTEENRPPIRQGRLQLRNNAGNTSRATSGDNNYGQISAYLSYDINNDWSIDADTSVDIASENSGQSWAVGISYSF